MLAEVSVLLRHTADGGIYLTGTGFVILALLWLGIIIAIFGNGSRR